jgi:hypothetical protein
MPEASTDAVERKWALEGQGFSMKPISYSSYDLWCTCPHKYKTQKIDKIYPIYKGSPLAFGNAADKLFNDILLGKPDEGMRKGLVELDRVLTEPTTFDSRDYDGDLLDISAKELVADKLRAVGWKGSNVDQTAQVLFEKQEAGLLSNNEERALALLCHASLTEKLRLMGEAYQTHVMPKIKSVKSVQTNVKRGILDAEIEFHGVEGVVTSDNKTSSSPYADDSVRFSVQLAGYGGKKAAYIVFNKVIRKNRTKECSVCGHNGTGKRHTTCDAIVESKRCNGEWIETVSPEVIPQIIIDDISESTRTMVEQAYQDVDKGIANEVFPRNLKNCQKQYGRQCEYINLCWNGSMAGLKQEKNNV